MFGKYTKAILGTLAAIATWGITAGADEHYEQIEFYGLLGAIVAAVVIAQSTNTVDGVAYEIPERPSQVAEWAGE